MSESVEMNIGFRIGIREVAPMVRSSETAAGFPKVHSEIKAGLQYNQWVDILESFSNDPENTEVFDWLRRESAKDLLKAWPTEDFNFSKKQLREAISQLTNI